MATEATSKADELLKLKQLLDSGALTQEEFDAQKAQLLAAPVQAQSTIQQPIQQAPPQVVINNTTSAVSHSKAKASVGRIRRKRSLLLDIIMIFLTGGLWIIWMILRPKYY